MTLQQKETKHRGRILQTTSEFDSLFISFVVRWAHSCINGAVDLAPDLFGKRRKAYDKVADKRTDKGMAYLFTAFFSRHGRKRQIYYIGGTDVLPQPLTPKEEEHLISCMGTVGEKEAKSRLIEHNLRLVVYIAKKFENTGVGVEDLISIGTIGLIKGINTFNKTKKIKLATYASRCIENEILMYLRRNSKRKTEVSIDEPLNVDWDGNELLLSDILGTDEDMVYRDMEEEAERRQLSNALSKLPSRERRIVELRYGINTDDDREMTQKEVADLMGISQSYISRLEKKIMNRLRKDLVRYG